MVGLDGLRLAVHRIATPNSPGVSACIIHNSHPAKAAVATAVRAKSKLARASRRSHQTSICTSARVRQADAIIGHDGDPDHGLSMASVRRRLNMEKRSVPAAHAQHQHTRYSRRPSKANKRVLQKRPISYQSRPIILVTA
jgi:hypothetical protein